MNHFLKLVAVALLPFTCVLSSAQGPTDVPVPFADPFILAEDGVYYMYGTSSDNGIAVVVSDDLQSWYVPDNQRIWLALNKTDSYGDRWFWAPEVYHVGDKYYMFYSAEEHICAAVSDSPLGPFIQDEQKPMLSEKGIDNTLFIDEDGTPYLFWVRFNNGNEIWSAQLEEDLRTVKTDTFCFCIRMSQDWEKEWPSVNEGPMVVKKDGTYYLTYSANSYESVDYGVGYATSDMIGGTWRKYDGNPVLHKPGDLLGAGHHSFFKDFNGKDRIVFHSHNGPDKVQPRVIHIGDWTFTKKGILKINEKDIITPHLSRDPDTGFCTNPVIMRDTPDPTILRDKDGMFYLSSTEANRVVSIKRSRNMVDWEDWSRIFYPGHRPDFVPRGGIWAPDISVAGNGYVTYYSMSAWGGEWECGIGRAVADNPKGPWTDLGKLFISKEIGIQNCIDPCFVSYKGRNYLFWGSFHGIYGAELNEAGTEFKEGVKPVMVAGTAYEGTYIMKRGKYWYLFASTGSCCEGMRSTYRTVVGRSKNIMGPYVDKSGRPMLENNHEILISGGRGFAGPGHDSEIVTDDEGNDWITYHSYWGEYPNEGRMLMLDRVHWDKKGWPAVNPSGLPSPVIKKPYIKP